jgi:hypothetical protein
MRWHFVSLLLLFFERLLKDRSLDLVAVTDPVLFERLGLSTHPSSLVKRRSARSKRLLPETRFLDFQF